MAVRVDQLLPGNRILVKLKRSFRISEQGTNPVAVASHRSRGTITEFTGVILRQFVYQGQRAMEVNWIDRKNHKHGKAVIPYVAIHHIWRYGGQKTSPVKNRTPTEDRTVASDTITWPYTANQMPPLDVYSEQIDLRWAIT